MKIGTEPKLLKISSNIKELSIGSSVDESLVLSYLKTKTPSPVYWQSADCVTFGMFTGDKIVFSEYKPKWEFLEDIRVFSDTTELHIWKYCDKYYGRLIEDKDGKADSQGNCYEHTVKLWGTSAKEKDGFCVLYEDRGMSLTIPCIWKQRYEEGINAFLKERHYLSDDAETGCAYISDRRFCAILTADESGKIPEIPEYIEV